ncbi:MAG: MoaD/ThiS family protein [Luteolibacter sp.]
MKMTVLAFAKSKDDFGFSEKEIEVTAEETPRQVVARIAPGMDVSGIRVALDCEFADWDSPVGEAKEMAFLPPVSGG